jgi:hypothetical protein
MQMAKRSTLRTPAVVKRLIDGLCDGTPLRELCRQDGMPNWRTVYLWTETDADFAAQVARARDTGTDAIAEQALDLIDTEPQRVDGKIDPGYVQWKRAQVDTRLKLLACWNPKKYGQKQTVDVGNKDGEALKVETNAAEVAANVAAALRAAKRDV